MDGHLNDEPFDWDVEKVIYEVLKNPDSPWSRYNPTARKLASDHVVSSFQDNDVSGEVLLTAITKNELQNDLNIKSLGVRSIILKAIDHLRIRSHKYNLYKSSAAHDQGDSSYLTPSIVDWRSGTASATRSIDETESILPAPDNSQVLRNLESVRPLPPLFDQTATIRPSIEHEDTAAPIESVGSRTLPLDEERLGFQGRLANTTGDKVLAVHQTHQKIPRRVAPILVGPLGNYGRPQTAIVNPERYLGLSPMRIDSLFYPNNIPETSHDFSFVSESKSLGDRRFVSRTMRSFLRQPIHSHENPSASFRLPYTATRLRGQPQQFTVFLPGTEPLQQRTVRCKAVEKLLRKKAGPKRMNDNILPKLEQLPPLADNDVLGDGDYFDELLEKYPENDADVVDFDDASDGGVSLDDETWAEILQEAEEEKENSIPRPKSLARERIDEVINDMIDTYARDWKENRVGKVSMQAYKLWKKVTVLGKRGREKAAWEDQADFLSGKIRKTRSEIASHTWDKESSLQRQCQSLEEHVYQREKARYFVEFLGSSKPPPRPNPQQLKRRTAKGHEDVAEGEEVLDSESDVSLDDFIVKDVSHAEPLAYSSNEDADSEASAQDESGSIHEIDTRQEYVVPSHLRQGLVPDDRSVVNNGEPSSATFKSASEGLAELEEGNATEEDVVAHKIDVTDDDDDVFLDSHELPTRLDSKRPLDVGDQDLDAMPYSIPDGQYSRAGHDETSAIVIGSDPPDISEDTSTEKLDSDDSSQPPITPAGKAAKTRKPLPSTRAASLSSCASDATELYDLASIQRLHPTTLEDRSDRKRLLVLLVTEMDRDLARDLLHHIDPLMDRELKDDIHNGADRLLAAGQTAWDQDDDGFGALKVVPTLARLYICWEHCKAYFHVGHIPKWCIEALPDISDGLHPFRKVLTKALEKLMEESSLPHTKQSKKGQRAGTSTSVANEHTPHKKRKRAVEDSQEALEWQEMDKKRLEDHEMRKIIASTRFTNDDVQNQPVISYGDVPIQLDPHIGSRIKPHQISGVEFMWREVVANRKAQGCLLAHTMGLGKTMQVIAFLSTLSQAAASPDPSISKQVPERLSKSKTLVLAPASLILNWDDEFTMWTPKAAKIGRVRHFDKQDTKQRMFTIQAWNDEGGVLLVSYDTFRNLLTKPGKMTEQQHQRVQERILSPNIIVADEAHRMKNIHGKLFGAASKFKSKARIALTGSPLANNLEEYYTMIQWVAPGYLGDLVQFKAKFSEPIAQGLYQDSHKQERRTCLKRLLLLKKTLEPKVNRADIGAIADDMPQKTEFFLTVPLTQEQEHAYTLFVASMLGSGDVDKASNTRIFAWLAVLNLLCNHPATFVDKLKAREKNTGDVQAGASAAATLADDESGAIGDVPLDEVISHADISPDSNSKQLDYFKNIHNLQDPRFSVKVTLIDAIIRFSVQAGDKVLLFSHTILGLDYYEELMVKRKIKYMRIDGKTNIASRQGATKSFNKVGSAEKVFLISMRAGGLGLNIPGANRVIIADFGFNPTWEEQAIGRAYRLGQKKPVFVYRFRSGGTFEEVIYNKAVFKTQLSARVVDHKTWASYAKKGVRDYLFAPKPVEQQDLSENLGKDPHVLDHILDGDHSIRNIELTETFQREDDEQLTAEELQDIQRTLDDEQLAREDPVAYSAMLVERQKQKESEWRKAQAEALMRVPAAASGTPYMPHIDFHPVAYAADQYTTESFLRDAGEEDSQPLAGRSGEQTSTPEAPDNEPYISELGARLPRASSEAPASTVPFKRPFGFDGADDQDDPIRSASVSNAEPADGSRLNERNPIADQRTIIELSSDSDTAPANTMMAAKRLRSEARGLKEKSDCRTQ